MVQKLLMGNEAFAHAALEAGVDVVAGYPGTPSSELVETVARLHKNGKAEDVYVEWSTNEKAALEVAAAASMSGARALFTCKQVGLNVASDALMSLNYVGVRGGLVIFVADDPGPISSQTEQDTRRFGMFAKVPVLDPATPEQGFIMMKKAFDLSETYGAPVILRTTTRVSHSSTFLEVQDRTKARPIPPGGFIRNPEQWVIFPRRAYIGHGQIIKRLQSMAHIFSYDPAFAPLNEIHVSHAIAPRPKDIIQDEPEVSLKERREQRKRERNGETQPEEQQLGEGQFAQEQSQGQGQAQMQGASQDQSLSQGQGQGQAQSQVQRMAFPTASFAAHNFSIRKLNEEPELVGGSQVAQGAVPSQAAEPQMQSEPEDQDPFMQAYAASNSTYNAQFNQTPSPQLGVISSQSTGTVNSVNLAAARPELKPFPFGQQQIRGEHINPNSTGASGIASGIASGLAQMSGFFQGGSNASNANSAMSPNQPGSFARTNGFSSRAYNSASSLYNQNGKPEFHPIETNPEGIKKVSLSKLEEIDIDEEEPENVPLHAAHAPKPAQGTTSSGIAPMADESASVPQSPQAQDASDASIQQAQEHSSSVGSVQTTDAQPLQYATGTTASAISVTASPNFSSTNQATLGIVTGGISTQYALDALEILKQEAKKAGIGFPEYRLMQIATPYPFPKRSVSRFGNNLSDILVLEELDTVIEDELLKLSGNSFLSPTIHGKLTDEANSIGENSTADAAFRIGYFFDKYNKQSPQAYSPTSYDDARSRSIEHLAEVTFGPNSLIAYDGKVPSRPPVLCAGCPHRGAFYAMKNAVKKLKIEREDAIFCGDIGCYTLGNSMPLDAVDTCLCMGADITMAQGFSITNPNKKAISFIGDSTFFASGMTGVANAVYNGHDITICILDNSTTAMTGSQPHPGTGATLMGSSNPPIDPVKVLQAMGVESIFEADPLDRESSERACELALQVAGPSVVMFKSPCVWITESSTPARVHINECTGCKKCITEIGCPAISFDKNARGAKSDRRGQAVIDPEQCNGCKLCVQVCPFHAIEVITEEEEALFASASSAAGKGVDAGSIAAASNQRTDRTYTPSQFEGKPDQRPGMEPESNIGDTMPPAENQPEPNAEGQDEATSAGSPQASEGAVDSYAASNIAGGTESATEANVASDSANGTEANISQDDPFAVSKHTFVPFISDSIMRALYANDASILPEIRRYSMKDKNRDKAASIENDLFVDEKPVETISSQAASAATDAGSASEVQSDQSLQPGLQQDQSRASEGDEAIEESVVVEEDADEEPEPSQYSIFTNNSIHLDLNLSVEEEQAREPESEEDPNAMSELDVLAALGGGISLNLAEGNSSDAEEPRASASTEAAPKEEEPTKQDKKPSAYSQLTGSYKAQKAEEPEKPQKVVKTAKYGRATPKPNQAGSGNRNRAQGANRLAYNNANIAQGAAQQGYNHGFGAGYQAAQQQIRAQQIQAQQQAQFAQAQAQQAAMAQSSIANANRNGSQTEGHRPSSQAGQSQQRSTRPSVKDSQGKSGSSKKQDRPSAKSKSGKKSGGKK